MNNDKYVGISRPRVLIADSDKRALQVYESALNGTLGPRAVLSTEALRHPDTGSLSFSHEPAYELCFCSYGKEAIQAFTSAIDTDSPFSVAIFDDALSPGTDIVEFVEMARALDPMVNIVLVSNPPVSSANALAKRVSALNDVLYWEKPLKELEVRQFVRALTEKWLAERHLQITRTRVQQLLTTSPIVIYSRTPNEHSKLTYLSENVREHLGYDPDSFLSNTSHWIDNIHPNDRFQALNEIFHPTGRKTYSVEYRLKNADGRYRWISDQSRILYDDKGRPKEIVGCWIDVTERRSAEERIRYLAYFDDLTGLPNRAFLREILNHSIASAERHNRRLAVLFLDIDHFKRINDTLGHDAGDKLLREVAKRLSTCLRSEDSVCRPNPEALLRDTTNLEAVSRLGGDEFVVMLNEINTSEDASIAAKRIFRALSAPLTMLSEEVTITPSIGISIFPDHGKTSEELLKNADTALYKSKENGRNTFSFFTENLNQQTARRFSLESKLRKALDKEEFLLYYQPIIDIREHRVLAVEALIRWKQADEGLISPVEFIPIAEDTGLIIPIDQWVYHEACRQLELWISQGLPLMKVSVNVSAVQLRELTLVDSLSKALDSSGLDPTYLQIELTENLLINNTEKSITILNEIKSIGAKICVDDFGTGYSSLSYLKKFPLDSLKVPRCFVRDISTDLNDAAIVSATVALAHNMGLRTVAEGIEEPEQFAILREQGCDEAQGYLFSPPLPPDAFVEWLADWQRRNPHETSQPVSQVLALAD